MKLYPNNTAAQYTTNLPRPISLDGGNWEVAVTKFSVLAIFDNVVRDTCYVKLISPGHVINNPTSVYAVVAGHYNDDSLLCYLNHHVANEGVLFVMKNGKVELLNSSNFNAYLNSTLMNKFGIVNMQDEGFAGGRHIAKNQYDINGETVQTLFVYCDILELVVVGDVMAPLLRMVDMKRKESYGKMQETPHALLYVPLQKKQFDTIEINIMTDTGDPVHFVDGKTVTFLEFMRLRLLDKVV